MLNRKTIDFSGFLSFKNLFLVSITGFLLFAYVLISKDTGYSGFLIYLKIAISIFASIAFVNYLSYLLIDIWFVQRARKQPSILLRFSVSLLLYIGCGFLVLKLLNQDISGLLTTSALLTILSGLALQPTLGNFFSAIILRVNQPFKLGDWISIKDIEGTVISITWRDTVIQGLNGTIIYIPNNLVAADAIKVVIPGGKISRSVKFIAPIEAPPQQVIDTVTAAVLNQPLANLNSAQPVRVSVWDYEISNEKFYTRYQLSYYPLKYSDANAHTDRELLRRVWYALKRENLFPVYSPAGFGEDYDQLIRSIELFSHLTARQISIVTEHIKPLYFDVGEIIEMRNLRRNTLFIVSQGCLRVRRKVSLNAGRKTFIAFSHRTNLLPPILLDEQSTQRVAEQLAHFIGPSAFEITFKAAQDFASSYWLYHYLAEEIPDQVQREEFLKFSPDAPDDQLRPNDFFGEVSLFLGVPLVDFQAEAILETEVLAVSRQAIVEVLQMDRGQAAQFALMLRQHINSNLVDTIQLLGTERLFLTSMTQESITHSISRLCE